MTLVLLALIDSKLSLANSTKSLFTITVFVLASLIVFPLTSIVESSAKSINIAIRIRNDISFSIAFVSHLHFTSDSAISQN
jgi:hypothetical protein